MTKQNNKDKSEWKEKLSREEYRITEEKGTEAPFKGRYYNHFETGTYHCVRCETPLFSSETKYKSGSGWPSFWDVLEQERIELKLDKSAGMTRKEALCAKCGAHLGHLFNDGPEPTGKRYCINSAALEFVAENE